MAILASFWVENAHASATPFGEGTLQEIAIIKVARNVDLERHVVGRIILRQHTAKELTGVKGLIGRQVLPKEFAAADDPAFTCGEKLQRKPGPFAIKADRVDIAFG